MTLEEFLQAPEGNIHLYELGLEYYVRKSRPWPGAIELAAVHNCGQEGFGLYKFLKRYSARVPFYMEQVLNPRLADYMRRLGWRERRIAGIPQFASPLLEQLHGGTPLFQAMFSGAYAPGGRDWVQGERRW